MPAPTAEDMTAFLDDQVSYDADEVASAYAAEKAAQSKLCLVPADGADWPADLVAALGRRVAVHLYMRSKPSGYESSIDGFGLANTTRLGGYDREVERLEAPYRVIAVA